MKKKISIVDAQNCRMHKEKYTMVTCYDYTTARIVNASKVNMILVGDSLGMVMLGYENTVAVTMEDMIHHTRSVVKGAPDTLVVGDMPFGSYNVSTGQAIENANRLMKEGGCDCIKLEGGVEMADTIRAIVKAGIAVIGHIGLTPQTGPAMGGFKVQGKSPSAAEKLMKDAKAIESAGASMIVVEGVPSVVAKHITQSINIPTIGIGAGIECDCQIMVLQDMLGMYTDFTPKFVKKYANLHETMIDALDTYHHEVVNEIFPSKEYAYNTKVDGLD